MPLALWGCGGNGADDPGSPATLAPTITTQPASASVVAPAAATFSVVAGGNPAPSYQWQASSDSGATFTDITGAAAAGYTTPATTIGDNGKRLRVRVFNSAGTVISAAVTLGVSATGPPAGLAGHPYAVSVDASGTLAVSVLPNYTTGANILAGVIQTVSPAGVFGTLAGGATERYVNGAGTAARFNGAYGIAQDAAGNVFVADQGNHTIRKISAAGVVSTVAGSAGLIGTTDGAGAAARFSAPRGVAVDAAGNVYVADTANHTIRKITPGGVVTTLAGSPASGGFVNGVGAAARFIEPRSVAVDAAGNVYVADTTNSAIRQVTPAGTVTTIAGNGSNGFVDGAGTAARFFGPTHLTVDASGNLWVADLGNHALRKITPAGVVSTFAR